MHGDRDGILREDTLWHRRDPWRRFRCLKKAGKIASYECRAG
jgi:hypothetical protein